MTDLMPQRESQEVKADVPATDEERRDCLAKRLESYLNRACQAEAVGNYVEAERMFRFALYCEGRSRLEVGSAREYAQQARPVYGDSQLLIEPAIQEENHGTRIEN